MLPQLYPRLVQYQNSIFYDGSGNVINLVTIISPNANKLLISDGTKNGILAVSNLSFVNNKLIITGNLQLNNGTQQSGYVLVSDSNGNASWTSSVSVEFYFQSSSPTPNNIGARWIHSETGYEYVWIYDGTNYNWFQPTQINDIPYTVTEINSATFSTDFEYEYYGVIYTGGICEVYLPSGTPTIDNGKIITIADEVGGISTYNRGIKVFGNGTQSINGYTDITMKVNKMSLTFIFRNGNWKTI